MPCSCRSVVIVIEATAASHGPISAASWLMSSAVEMVRHCKKKGIFFYKNVDEFLVFFLKILLPPPKDSYLLNLLRIGIVRLLANLIHPLLL